MNEPYRIGITQKVLYKEALKYHKHDFILSKVEMHEDLFREKLLVDLDVINDQLGIKLYFILESLIPVQEYYSFKNRMIEKYKKRLEKFEIFKKRHSLVMSTNSAYRNGIKSHETNSRLT